MIKAIVDMIGEENVKESRVAISLEDIQKMKGLFDKCIYIFSINRLGNNCAHNLAKFAVKLVRDVDWEGNFFIWLKESAQNDLLGSNPFVADLVISS